MPESETDIAVQFFNNLFHAFSKSEKESRTAIRVLASKCGVPRDEFFLGLLDEFVDRNRHRYTQR